jgi:hypothetical protein
VVESEAIKRVAVVSVFHDANLRDRNDSLWVINPLTVRAILSHLSRSATTSFQMDRRPIFMAKVSPWHSKLENDPRVYHNNTDCNTGNNIEDENRVEGTGGRPLCKECAGLS